jgi:signal transduction histidine kinase
VVKAVEAELEAPPPAVAPLPPEEAFTRDHRDLLHGTLVRKVGDLEEANHRLSALIGLGQQLALQYDATLLLDLYCHAAREILGARCAVVGIRNDVGPTLRHFFTSGMNPQTFHCTRLSLDAMGADVSGLAERKPRRLVGLNGDPTAAGLPAAHPAIDSYLGVAIATPARAYGWLYLADKIGAGGFSEDDERVAVMLAAQLAVAYENAQRYDQLQRRAAELEGAVKDLEAFSYSVSHDLRGPLRAVGGYAQALEEDHGGRLDDAGRRYVGLIQEGVRDLGRLIDDLLESARLGRRPTAAPEGAAVAAAAPGEGAET